MINKSPISLVSWGKPKTRMVKALLTIRSHYAMPKKSQKLELFYCFRYRFYLNSDRKSLTFAIVLISYAKNYVWLSQFLGKLHSP